MEKYSWDKKSIFKLLLNNLNNKEKKYLSKNDLLLDRDNLKDMILYSILGLPEIIGPKLGTKRYLNLDRCFLETETSEFQRKIIDQQLKLITNYKIKLSEITFSYNSHNNIVKQSLDFFSSISPEIYSLLLKSIEYKTLSIKNNRFEKSYSGVTYSLYNNSYYDIFLNSLANPFITLNHELMHGYVNLISNRKFDNLSNNILYREVGSLLIEIYANEYLLRNKLISYDEYVTNFSDLLLNNIYNDIEIIVILFTFAKNLEMKNDLSNVKKFIDDKACVNPNYDIKIKELTNLPLKHHLIYMYSALIAISLYDNFKDDTKDAIKAALDIMVNVDSNNEEEIFKKYNLNINQSLENYIQKNNQLVMKKNS